MVVAALLQQKYLPFSGEQGHKLKLSTPLTNLKALPLIKQPLLCLNWPACYRHLLATPAFMATMMWSNRPLYWPFQWSLRIIIICSSVTVLDISDVKTTAVIFYGRHACLYRGQPPRI